MKRQLEAWNATFDFTSFRKCPEPRTARLHLKVNKEKSPHHHRRVIVELTRSECDRLATVLADHARRWDEDRL